MSSKDDDDIFEMILRELRRVLKEISRTLIEIGELNEGFKGEVKEFFGIRVDVVEGDKTPRVIITRFNPGSSRTLKRERDMVEIARTRSRRIKCVLKPRALLSESNREVFIAIEVPDVKSERDVEVRPVGKSIEVLAVKGNGEVYFDIFEIPSNADISSMVWELKDGRLEIKIPKIRGYSHW